MAVDRPSPRYSSRDSDGTGTSNDSVFAKLMARDVGSKLTGDRTDLRNVGAGAPASTAGTITSAIAVSNYCVACIIVKVWHRRAGSTNA